ncbi:hypothetical protein [Variovorax sp. Root411]|uniref:hypothetical protein n=1 Tax=Variovorax sp. Root411 TaxID=1736530 RepID=UPI000AFDE975|nr:hypothetical protein [Variovorax sp. Root411]
MHDDASDRTGPPASFDFGAASTSDSRVIDHSVRINFDKHAVPPENSYLVVDSQEGVSSHQFTAQITASRRMLQQGIQ